MLETGRLLLDKPDLKYIDELYLLHTNKEATQYTPKGIHESKEVTKRFIEGWIRHWEENNFGYFILITEDSKEVAGITEFEYRTINYQRFLNLYYRFFSEFTKQGLATERIDKISYSLKHYDSITPKIIHTNQPSIKLAERLGYIDDLSWNNIINKGNPLLFYSTTQYT
ncbi:GNAT family N-acetyltransferase [Staphylococcus saccharolyticus]|uniref:Acetyltransferase n=1 Tax=Staphylococcus saccharolyticus TaxID=33028 RepID=A0A380GYX9_9STAP|nr:GNAT family N-acetyltransferase [Staphylococcus saccharolyticus]MBL7564576.1 GNAT family N-acetyltransferase [Staphylococcus saccharolyticus]MBL7571160.1 GNAT family N-acetyltransferase [Staphylococcus saccharolyticus]QQB99324.1 GNAT family N-acetyltransferase [Staphylococcus saccharolyticus]QRJ67462.1 GNAT family N-acetyltransferase [Staphylococcus saccharolyticus]RTY00389.1 N-acetyltransferase [Staphylococcus saccharolyticus]